MTLRPFINYNLSQGWFLGSSPTITASWEANSANRWLVPLGDGVGKVFVLGKKHLSLVLEGYYHVISPNMGRTGSSGSTTFLLPNGAGSSW
jgi:hypothetical protein